MGEDEHVCYGFVGSVDSVTEAIRQLGWWCTWPGCQERANTRIRWAPVDRQLYCREHGQQRLTAEIADLERQMDDLGAPPPAGAGG